MAAETGGRFLIPMAAALSVLAIALSSFIVGERLGGRPVIHVTVPTLSPYAVLSDPGSQSAEDVAFSPDGKILAVGDRNGSTYLWNPSAAVLLGQLHRTGQSGVSSVAFSPDGKILAVGDSNGGTYLWNLATDKHKTTFRCAGSGGITAVAFSPDGKILAAGGSSDRGLTCLWDPATGVRLARLRDGGGGIGSVAFSPDGKILAVGDRNGSTYLWSPSAAVLLGQLHHPGQSGVSSVAFSPDGKILAVGDSNGSTYLWDLAARRQIGPALRDPGRSSGINTVAFSPDGKILATADGNGSTYLRDLATRKLIAVLADPRSGGTNAAEFSPDGATLATADRSGRAYLWEPPAAPTPTPTPTPTPAKAEAEAAAVSNVLASGNNSDGLLVGATNNAQNCVALPRSVRQIRQVRDQRQAEYDQAQTLLTGALSNGAALKRDLMRALSASLSADNDYLTWARQQDSDCQVGTAPAGISSTNTQTLNDKTSFIGLWNPIAEQYGLQQITTSTM